MKKLILVAGARPNFMKIAPIIRALDKEKEFEYRIVHTGQHYDTSMSQTFFEELGIPKPDYNLNAGSSSHSAQTADIMVKFEKVCLKENPDTVVVVGDVNSTLACGLVAKKLCIDLAHVEAGLRSGDRTMPEEINRVVTDSISDYLFVTEPSGVKNLIESGSAGKIHFVGHVMVDNLYYQLEQIERVSVLEGKKIKSKISDRYAVLTLHRPSNADNKEILTKLLLCFNILAKKIPVIFPCHPRTLSRIKEFGLEHLCSSWGRDGPINGDFVITPPLGYMDFLYLWKDAVCVITDSGGLQEETTALKVPCITFRETTERPITVETGSNEIAGTDVDKINFLFQKALLGNWKKSTVPELWDGRAGERIVKILSGS
jgi:UDP-N-acetylglucosamine 2-epimerase (non-hydrolysing)